MAHFYDFNHSFYAVNYLRNQSNRWPTIIITIFIKLGYTMIFNLHDTNSSKWISSESDIKHWRCAGQNGKASQ